ncbi:MAG TPA: right-handed parallel beta-helix repeat-containing protein [Polyangia bacterium]|nr:right-handed parallel beta-helix repeat-containing protein [Polyangia bacterium]
MPPARSSARRAAASFVVVTALALGCSLDDRHQLTLQLGTAGNCVRTSIACGGEVGVFVTDAKTNEVLDMRCIPFAADPTMTLEKLPLVLADVMPPLPELASGRSIVVEVAAYSPTSGKGCPRFSPDVGGNPAVPSYFGKSSPSAVGAAASIAVSLQCLPTACLPCTKLAAPTGTDPDGGVADAGVKTPFKTAARLVSSLTAGQIGCLEDGTYAENVTFSKTGSNASPITLTAAPGAHPVLKGVLTIPDTTDYITIANLTLDGAAATTKSASPLVRGDHVALRGNDITNVGGDCVTLGDPSFGTAKLTDIEGNRIHGCKTGVVGHTAESGEVAHNFIFDNTGDGVALTPNGDSFTVEHDLIDGNGSGFLFGSDGKVVSINDVVRTSIISNSTVGFDVDSSYPGPVGTGNSATQNCLWMGAKGLVVAPAKGFSAKDNTTADPMFVDRAAKDFRLMANSACQGLGPLR